LCSGFLVGHEVGRLKNGILAATCAKYDKVSYNTLRYKNLSTKKYSQINEKADCLGYI
jgi:hypothetical protein